MPDRKAFSIGILSLTATVLFVANFMPLQTASADAAIKDRDYTVVTSKATSGNDALYVVDNRTGVMGVFTWDNQARAVKLRAVKPVADAFQ